MQTTCMGGHQQECWGWALGPRGMGKGHQKQWSLPCVESPVANWGAGETLGTLRGLARTPSGNLSGKAVEDGVNRVQKPHNQGDGGGTGTRRDECMGVWLHYICTKVCFSGYSFGWFPTVLPPQNNPEWPVVLHNHLVFVWLRPEYPWGHFRT